MLKELSKYVENALDRVLHDSEGGDGDILWEGDRESAKTQSVPGYSTKVSQKGIF